MEAAWSNAAAEVGGGIREEGLSSFHLLDYKHLSCCIHVHVGKTANRKSQISLKDVISIVVN